MNLFGAQKVLVKTLLVSEKMLGGKFVLFELILHNKILCPSMSSDKISGKQKQNSNSYSWIDRACFHQDWETGCCCSCSVAVCINILPMDILKNKILLSRMTLGTRNLPLSIFLETNNLLTSFFSATRSLPFAAGEVLDNKILCPSIFSAAKFCGQKPGKISKKRLTTILLFLQIIVTEDILGHKILLTRMTLDTRK